MVDAGARYLGYGADITRTWARGAGVGATLFAALVDELDRLGAIATLAAGVAHEVNNPAAYVLMNLTTSLDHVAELRQAMVDAGPAARPQVKPPLPLAPVPADAEVITGVVEAPTARVLIKRLRAGTGGRPGRNDNVELEFSGWRPNGDTFITTAARKRALPRNLATTAPGFAAAVQSMQVGERAMVWVPAELSYPGQPTGTPEATIYEIELVGFEPSPPTPPDVGAPPATAAATPSGLRSLVVKPGTGTTHPRSFDLVTYHYTAWDATGRLFDSSELRKRPTTTLGFREFRGIEEALTLMVVGERRRVWLPPSLTEQSLPGLPRGTLCYELEVTDLVPKAAPPPAPSRAELAAPPSTRSRSRARCAGVSWTPARANA